MTDESACAGHENFLSHNPHHCPREVRAPV
jgi:hypothetical protein